MKILFDTSVTGRDKYEENYRAIDKVLNEMGHEVTSPVFIAWKNDVKEESEEQALLYYKNLRKWIREADIMVVEVSYPSLGVGYEITWALQLGKPVIALYVKGKKPLVLETLQDEKLQVIEYGSSSLQREVESAVRYAIDQQDTRFNFFVSPKISNYLDWVAKNWKVPRAVFLRRLIEDDMKSNGEYNKT